MFELSEIQKLIDQRKKFPVKRKILVEVLQEQNKNNSSLAQENIQKLLHEDSFSVCTGQQLGWAGGPLFVIYKALSVIYLAEKWTKLNPENPVIPIFWMASEDHDWEEVNHFFTDFQTKFQFPATNNGPVGRFKIPEYSLKTSETIQTCVKKFWKPGISWTLAFRTWLEELFSNYGLVILDPDDARLKKLAKPLWDKELIDEFSFPLIQNENEKILQEGGKIQLQARSINLFVMDDENRIKIEPNGIELPNNASEKLISFKKQFESSRKITDELMDMISPNAALRPVFQEMILPNLAYIAGNAEIAYWKQLTGVFNEMKVFLPILIKRASGKLILKSDEKILNDLDLPKEFIFKNLYQIRNELVEKFNWGIDLDEWELLDQIFDQMENKLNNHFPELTRSAKSLRKTLENRKKQLHKKIISQALNKHSKIYKPILAMKYRTEPDGFVQERRLSIFAFCTDLKEIHNFVAEIYKQLTDSQLDPFLISLDFENLD